jgi:hypothetical protein
VFLAGNARFCRENLAWMAAAVSGDSDLDLLFVPMGGRELSEDVGRGVSACDIRAKSVTTVLRPSSTSIDVW